MTNRNQYVKVLSHNDQGVCLEYVPGGQVVTLSDSYFKKLSVSGALKILGIS